jgi:glutaredoxin-related protein
VTEGQGPDTTAGRLAEYTVLMNRHGPDSAEARAYLDKCWGDPEFVSLARVARNLRAALAGRQREGPADD